MGQAEHCLPQVPSRPDLRSPALRTHLGRAYLEAGRRGTVNNRKDVSPRACPELLSYSKSTRGVELVPSPGSREGGKGREWVEVMGRGEETDQMGYGDRDRDRETGMKDTGREKKTEHQDQRTIQHWGQESQSRAVGLPRYRLELLLLLSGTVA